MNDQLEQTWDACRWLNQYLGVIVALLLMYRLVPMLLDWRRWADPPERHRMLWFVYIVAGALVGSLAAAHYGDTTAAADWTSAARTFLYGLAICLCLWWPHPRTATPAP